MRPRRYEVRVRVNGDAPIIIRVGASSSQATPAHRERTVTVSHASTARRYAAPFERRPPARTTRARRYNSATRRGVGLDGRNTLSVATTPSARASTLHTRTKHDDPRVTPMITDHNDPLARGRGCTTHPNRPRTDRRGL
ncbi:hypothetical protein MTO96_027091 [Rhipicephalus appendiculatus]